MGAFRRPSESLHRGRLVAADTELGMRLLEESGTVDYVPLTQHYQGQESSTCCGAASSVIALNALLGRSAHSQSAFLTSVFAVLREQERVEKMGMTLAELGLILASHGARVTVHHALDEGLEKFREVAEDNLSRHGDFVIVNYLREVVGQLSGGHFSPLAAFHPASDRFLVLDVADFKYSPVWVETEMLFEAMATVDPCSGRSRGFVAVAL